MSEEEQAIRRSKEPGTWEPRDPTLMEAYEAELITADDVIQALTARIAALTQVLEEGLKAMENLRDRGVLTLSGQAANLSGRFLVSGRQALAQAKQGESK